MAQAKPAEAAKDQETKPAGAPSSRATRERRRSGNRPSRPAPAVAGQKDEIEPVDPAELVLGSAADQTPGGYRLEVQLEQNGRGGRTSVASSRYEAEFEKRPEPPPAAPAVQHDTLARPSLALSVLSLDADAAPTAPEAGAESEAIRGVRSRSTQLLWEVVRDDQGRDRPADPGRRQTGGGARVRRSSSGRTVGQPGVTLTKTYRLLKGEDGFDVELEFESPEQGALIVYKLLGPHGIPIEGEWYTGTFRDVFFGQVDGRQGQDRDQVGPRHRQGEENPETLPVAPA